MKTISAIIAIAFSGLLLDASAVAQGSEPPSAYTASPAELQPPLAKLGSEYESAYARDHAAMLLAAGAQEPNGEVEIPYGNWVSSILVWLIGLAGMAAAWLLRALPATLVSALDSFAGMMGQGRANELLEKAITYGINTTAGAVKGKSLTVKVGMEVLERALEYAVRHAPQFVEVLGGAFAVREKILARLDFEADASLPAPKPPAEALITAGGAD